jgi:Coenzyme PQQ synthesis protein D (PqqD)
MNIKMQMREGVVQQAVGNVLMLMDAKQGRYLELNETGALIVNALLAGASAQQAAAQLSASYQVSTAQALEDVSKLTDELVKAQLVEMPR